MARVIRNITIITIIIVALAACSTSSAPSSGRSCEQRFDNALANGTPYTEALGAYTQCLINRGDRLSVQDVVSQ